MQRLVVLPYVLTQVDETFYKQGRISCRPQTGVSLPQTLGNGSSEVEFSVLMDGNDRP